MLDIVRGGVKYLDKIKSCWSWHNSRDAKQQDIDI